MSLVSKLFGAFTVASVSFTVYLAGRMTAWKAAGLPMVNSGGKKGFVR